MGGGHRPAPMAGGFHGAPDFEYTDDPSVAIAPVYDIFDVAFPVYLCADAGVVYRCHAMGHGRRCRRLALHISIDVASARCKAVSRSSLQPSRISFDYHSLHLWMSCNFLQCVLLFVFYISRLCFVFVFLMFH